MGVRTRCCLAGIAVVCGCLTDSTAGTTESSLGEASESDDVDAGGPPESTDDESSTSLVSSGQPSGADGGLELCPETHDCVAAVPLDWLGPVALVERDDAICPDLYPTLEIDAFTDVLAAPARCTCACDASTLCGGLIGSDIESACEFPTAILQTIEFPFSDVCEPLPALEGGALHLAFDPDPLAACLPTSTSTIPTTTTTGRVLGCTEPEPIGGCEGDLVCAPRVLDGEAIAPCIVRAGAHECPVEYPVARTAWTDVLDERACSTCECTGSDGAPTCTATVRISSTDDCSAEELPDFELGAFACVPNDGAALSYLSYSDVTTIASGCAPSGGVAIGTVAPTEPLTICCGS